MGTRNILDYQGNNIGQMTLPDSTSEQEWTDKLAEYSKQPVTQSEIASSYLSNTIQERKKYAEDLLERFKKKNINEGINALQGMWMHNRMRAASITFYGVPFTIDVMNLAVSGDIEIACLTLMNVTPDDDSMPYHWLNTNRVNWLVTDMKQYLGWS